MDKMTSEMMRNFNRRQVFNLIYKEKRISRIHIAEVLGLSLPTVTQNLKSLEEAHLIEKNGTFQSTGGRKSFVYSCASNTQIAIGTHITKHNIRIVAVDIYGNIIKREVIRETYSHSPEYYQKFGNVIESFIKSLNVSTKRILGVGIALMALLSKDRQSVKKSILLGTADATLADFKEWIDYPCQLFHDSESAAYAELWYSPQVSDALYLGINNFLNGVLIMNGKIHEGKEFTGSLVEHMVLYPKGRKCYCGRKGCLSTYCSGHVLFDDNIISCEEFFERLRTGEKEAVGIWQIFLNDLSIAIGSLYAVLDCDIILGGSISAYMNTEDVLLLQQLVRKDYQYAPSSDFIRLGHRDVDIAASGAAISYIADFLESL